MEFLWNEEMETKIVFMNPDQAQRTFGPEAPFKGKPGDVLVVVSEKGQGTLYLGLGPSPNTKAYRAAGYHGAKAMEKQGLLGAQVDFKGRDREALTGFLEGLLEAGMRRWNLKTDQKTRSQRTLSLMTDLSRADFHFLVRQVQNLAGGIQTTRDLVNQPSSHMTPETFCQATRSLLIPLGVRVSVYNQEALEEMGMAAFLAVAKGSKHPAKMIVMEYEPVAGQKPVALVGKGLTYDSGGFHLKPVQSMRSMHCDMAGAATVVGAIEAIAKNGVQKNVTGVCCLCENILSRDAYKNGDVIGSMKGLTIEVGDTDAEGRLTLADALYYTATRLDPEVIIDLATLTGSCVVGLGPHMAGAMTNDQAAYQKLYAASQKAGEYVWQLPLYEEVYQTLDSDVADLRNDIDGPPGAIIAGAFLNRFVEDRPWIHLDIAGPAYLEKAWGILPKDATGVPLKTIYHFVAEA